MAKRTRSSDLNERARIFTEQSTSEEKEFLTDENLTNNQIAGRIMRQRKGLKARKTTAAKLVKKNNRNKSDANRKD
jgi:hypothetical protein